MEAEKELLEVPGANDTSIDDEDFFADVDSEVLNGSNNNTEEESNSTEEEGSTPTEPTEEEKNELDYTPFLKDLSGRVKYNKESVNIENVDDVIANYQKGLNYDKLQDKLTTLENSKGLSYLKTKADEFGMSVDDYISSIEKQEQEHRKAQEEKRIEQMIENGVPEDVAREVVATAELRRQLQEKENKLNQQEKEREQREKKEKEYQEFLEQFPDVKAEDIPKDVFLNAQKSNLKTAYLEYQNAELKKQLEISKTNEKNQNTTVGSTTEYGGVHTEKIDPFLEGFDSED